MRVSDHWICPTRDPEEFRAPHIKLFPGEVVLASTIEYVRIPRDVACDLKLKSTLGRLWINHSLAGWCDPGFEGNITLELQNLGPEPFVLEAGRRIAQLIFIAMESEPEVAYGEPGSRQPLPGAEGDDEGAGVGRPRSAPELEGRDEARDVLDQDGRPAAVGGVGDVEAGAVVVHLRALGEGDRRAGGVRDVGVAALERGDDEQVVERGRRRDEGAGRAGVVGEVEVATRPNRRGRSTASEKRTPPSSISTSAG